MMQETNRAFVSDAGMHSQFAVLFNELASAHAGFGYSRAISAGPAAKRTPT